MELSFKHQFGLICVIVFLTTLCNCTEYVTNSRATYYGTSDGYGTPSGACGFGEIGRKMYNYNGSVAAVSGLWNNGAGCGTCYKVWCKIPQLCKPDGVTLVATDYGIGDRTDFIMSPNAFSNLGRNKDAYEKLKKYGTVDVAFVRVRCTYPGNILLQIQKSSSNPGYFTILILKLNGIHDITAVEMWKNGRWEALRRVYGTVFDFQNPPSGEIRLRLQATNYGWVYPKIAIPSNWKPGATYDTQVQIY